MGTPPSLENARGKTTQAISGLGLNLERMTYPEDPRRSTKILVVQPSKKKRNAFLCLTDDPRLFLKLWGPQVQQFGGRQSSNQQIVSSTQKLGGFTFSFQKLSEVCILCCVKLPPLTFHLYNCKFTSRCQAFYYWRVLGCKRVSMPKFIQWALNYGWLTGIWGRAWPNQQTNEQFFAKFGSTHFC